MVRIRVATSTAVLAICAAAHGQTTQPSRDAILARGGNAKDLDMAPDTNVDVVRAAVAMIPNRIPAGPVQPAWESLQANYAVPKWFEEARFGIFLHWGLFSVAAHHNEWYEKHMYGNAGIRKWHVEKFGAEFGYKDLIPKFTAERFDADEWADLFAKSGARYVIPPAQHHENFAMWDSAVTPFNAKAMGPKRDLLGELSVAIRKRGLKFGIANHGIENFTFINPPADLAAELKAKQADLFDPKWADFYNVADRSDEALKKFLANWARRNAELIDKYQPDLLWFDNGVDQRFLDPLKLWLAAYYYNAAAARGQSVTLSTKKAAFAPSDDNTRTIASVLDFEKVGGRSPAGVRPGAWQVDDSIASNTWGYTDEIKLLSVDAVLFRLVDTVSKNGNFVLNLAPKSDGTIPDDQRAILLEIGAWLKTNGDAIYGTHAWSRFGDGATKGPNLVRYTVKGDTLYAILLNPTPGKPVTLSKLGDVHVRSIKVLGDDAELAWQAADDNGATVTLPARLATPRGVVLKIEGAAINVSTATKSGNPE